MSKFLNIGAKVFDELYEADQKEAQEYRILKAAKERLTELIKASNWVLKHKEITKKERSIYEFKLKRSQGDLEEVNRRIEKMESRWI